MTVLAEPARRAPGPAEPAARVTAHRVGRPSAQGLLGLSAVAAMLVVGVLALTTEPTAAPSGVAVAGPVTERVLSVSRGVSDLALCAVVGELLWGGWLLRRGDLAAIRLLSAARWSAALWLVASVTWGWSTTADVLGRPLPSIELADLEVLWGLPQGKALAAVTVTASAVALLASRIRVAWQSTALLVVAMAGTSPLLLTGHAAASSSHYLAGQALLVHVLAVVPWVGGLLAAAAHLRREPDLLVALLPRYSAIALVCFVATAVSGLVGVWSRLAFDLDLWTSTYGALVLAKSGCLVALGVCGALHRAMTLRRMEAGRPRAFLRLAVGELLVMGVAVALAVVLSRTSPPAGALTRAAPPHASAFPTVDRGISPLSLRTLVTESRPDALLVTGVAVLIAAYLLAVHAARSDGRLTGWPVARVAAFLAGAAVVLWALCGGLGAYATSVFSAQVGQLLALMLLAPPLLVLGLQPVLGAGSWAVRRFGAADGVLSVLLLTTALYATPLLALSLRSTLAHVLASLAALTAGVVLAVPLGRLVSEGRFTDLSLLVGVPGVVLVVLGLRLRPVAGPVAGGWFERLSWWWADPVADQRLASLLVGATGGLLLVAALLFLMVPRRGGAQ